MRPKVQIGFDLSLAGAGDFLTLSDPVKGALDDADYPLAGDILTDVSDDVRSVSVKRGRSNETTSVDAGSATVVLDNRLRLYDPTAAASVSPYGPSILPRKEIVISVDDDPIFTGQVEDWDLQYSGKDSVTLAKASDGFTLLTQQTLASGAGFTGLSGSVIYDTVEAIGWPMGRTTLDEGTASVGAHDIGNDQRALPYLQKITGTESGLLFIGKDATLTFRDRISPRVDMGTLFADDGTGIAFSNIEITYGSEFLYTQVEVKYPTDQVETATSGSLSILNYGLTTYTLDTFLPDASSASVIAGFLAGRYGEPTFRITGLELNVDALTPAQQTEVLGLELGHGVTVLFTPNGIGDPIYRDLAVDSIEHVIAPGSHVVKFKFFEPFLSSGSGSVSGVSGTSGSVIGFEGDSGFISGSVTGTGSVFGFRGMFGSVTGSVGSSGTVTGVKAVGFALDTSQLDGSDTLV